MNTRYAGVCASILDAIGDTPLLEIEGIYAKLEFLNPSGSIKARIAHYIECDIFERPHSRQPVAGRNQHENGGASPQGTSLPQNA